MDDQINLFKQFLNLQVVQSMDQKQTINYTEIMKKFGNYKLETNAPQSIPMLQHKEAHAVNQKSSRTPILKDLIDKEHSIQISLGSKL